MRDVLLRLMVTTPMLTVFDALAQDKGKGKGKGLDPTAVPEPGSIELLAIGAVSVLVAIWLKKRKK